MMTDDTRHWSSGASNSVFCLAWRLTPPCNIVINHWANCLSVCIGHWGEIVKLQPDQMMDWMMTQSALLTNITMQCLHLFPNQFHCSRYLLSVRWWFVRHYLPACAHCNNHIYTGVNTGQPRVDTPSTALHCPNFLFTVPKCVKIHETRLRQVDLDPSNLLPRTTPRDHPQINSIGQLSLSLAER